MTQPNHQTTGYNQNKPVEEMTDPAEKLMLVSKVSRKYQRKTGNLDYGRATRGIELENKTWNFQLR